MYLISLLLIIVSVVFFIWSMFVENKFLQSWMAFMSGALLVLAILYTQPSAYDVYKGKTALRITYENNIPKDTTVIWKR